jgi:phage shock protein A
MKTTEAKENGNEQKDNLKQKFANLFEEKISSYEKTIGELKAKLALETRENIAKYEKTLADLEQKVSEIKKKVHEYKEEGKDKWAAYNDKFNHDLDELGKALKNFTVKSK